MKKFLLLLFAPLVILSACSKKNDTDPSKQVAIDDAAIKAYLAANPGIHATEDASGLYYQIITEGSGNNPTINSTVTVNYTGKFLDGTTFDTGNGFTAALSGGLITGWKIGIPYAKATGRILLIIPSRLGYGPQGYGSIPANAVLVFTIDLLSFK